MPTDLSITNKISNLGLLSLAASVSAYGISESGLYPVSAATLGIVLLFCGGLQILAGLYASKIGRLSAVATFMPLGMLWLSLIGFEVFPRLGVGQVPGVVSMVAYLSMWSLFAAILFLGSFRQSRALQLVFFGLLLCLMFVAMGKLRGNQVFLITGGVAGLLSGLAALYTGLAQQCNQWLGRAILPLGQWQGPLKGDLNDQLLP